MNDMNLASVFDTEVLGGLRELQDEGEPDLVVELMSLFVEDAPERHKQIEDAANQGDAKGVERSAHALKSASANLGAKELSASCAALEVLGRGGDLSGLEMALLSFRGCYDAALAEAQQIIRSGSPEAG